MAEGEKEEKEKEEKKEEEKKGEEERRKSKIVQNILRSQVIWARFKLSRHYLLYLIVKWSPD